MRNTSVRIAAINIPWNLGFMKHLEKGLVSSICKGYDGRSYAEEQYC